MVGLEMGKLPFYVLLVFLALTVHKPQQLLKCVGTNDNIQWDLDLKNLFVTKLLV